MTSETTAHRIPLASLPRLEALVAKLAKRAAKLGVEAPALTVAPAEPIEIPAADGMPRRFIDAVEVALVGPTVALPGWSFLGRIEPADAEHPELGNVLFNLPGAAVAVETRFATAALTCEHCNARRRRNASFVVLEEATGVQRQVGSSCLADFLGHAEAERMASFLAAWAAVEDALADAERDEDGFRGTAVEAGVALEDVLLMTASAIRLFGWVAASTAGPLDRPTKILVLDALARPKRDTDGWAVAQAPNSASEIEEVEQAIDWAASITDEEAERSDFLLNIRTIAKVGIVRRRSAGLAVSILPSFRRHVERETRRAVQAKANRVETEFLGKPGDKVTVRGTVVGRSFHDGDFGTRTRVQVLADDGSACLVWWASRIVDEVEVGGHVEIEAKVKRHDVFQAQKQTIVTHAKLTALCGA